MARAHWRRVAGCAPLTARHLQQRMNQLHHLIVLALLAGLVYLMQKLLNVTPTYTSLAQDYVYIAEGYIKRATEAIVKPVLQLNGILASINAFFERMK